ncbi:MAG: serpin family protein [Deltaproteobacteria bacterium]|nr:serpin family protein [Deltaproteobacteria bacterium]
MRGFGKTVLAGLSVFICLACNDGSDSENNLESDSGSDTGQETGSVTGDETDASTGQTDSETVTETDSDTVSDSDSVTDSDSDTVFAQWENLPQAAPNLPVVDEFSSEGATISDAVNRFGLHLFAKLDAEESGNIFISPFSISSALAMAWNGSVAPVEPEMRNVLSYEDLEVPAIQKGYQNLAGGLPGLSDQVILEIANALWYRNDIVLRPEYITEATNYFGVYVNQLHGDPLVATQQVNAWVNDKTHGLIPQIVPANAPFTGDTAAVLANTVYFKGEWRTKFDSNYTSQKEFTTLSGAVQATMMRRPDAYLPYFENDTLQMVRLPYKGEEFAMTAVLPKEGASVDDILKTLDADAWQQWQIDLQPRSGTVGFPKFKMSYKSMLNTPLIEMGMPTAFDFTSGWDKMVPDHVMGISRVMHNTSLDINEEGTEAAGATVIEYTDSAAMDPFDIFFNKPFLVFIHDTETNTILFMGRIEDPTL